MAKKTRKVKHETRSPGGTPSFLSRTPVQLFLIVLCGAIPYLNTFAVPFVFDDLSSIVRNPRVWDLSSLIDSPRSFLTQTRLIGFLSFALNYRLHGLNVAGYHAVNLSIHLINGLLLHRLIITLLRTPFFAGRIRPPAPGTAPLAALVAALFFVAHPVQTQAVTYIVQRFASLATLFYLLSAVLYLHWRLGSTTGSARPAGSHAIYILSVIAALAAMKTKEIAFTLPFTLAAAELMFFRGKVLPRLLLLVPLFLACLIIPLGILPADRPLSDALGDVSEVTRVRTTLPRWDYLMTETRVVVTYLRLLVLPVGQNLDHDYPVYHSLLSPPVAASFLIILSLGVLSVYLFRRSRLTAPAGRLLSFGFLWFFIALSVESSLVPIVDVIFEHRLYLPSAGFAMALCPALIVLEERRLQWAPLVMSLVLLLMAGATVARNAVWKDRLALWADAAVKSPAKVRPHVNLGVYYDERGQRDKALAEYLIALELGPDSPDVHNNLGVSYKNLGRLGDAEAEYRMALRLNPSFAEAHNNLGVLYRKTGRPGEAVRELEAGIALYPFNPDAYDHLGLAYGEQGRLDEAVRAFTASVRLRPDRAESRYNLGLALARRGDYGPALDQFLAAITIDPGYADAHYNAGLIHRHQGNAAEAQRYFEEAKRLDALKRR